MRLEIVSATNFLVQLLRLHPRQLSESQLQLFKSSLKDLLRRRYQDHWFPDKPSRGSGYRCIRINRKMDPVIAQAGINVGLGPILLHSLFPSELTVWIDPAEVSYRIGENGSICTLFEGSQQESSSSSSSGSVDEHCHHRLYRQSQQVQQQFYRHLHHYQQHHHHRHHRQQPQQQFESCKDSLLLEHTQFNEQIATSVFRTATAGH